MTPERMNEIFKDLQELREFIQTGGVQKMTIKLARQNGHTTRALKFIQQVEMLTLALNQEEVCFNCAHLDNKRVCNDCILGYHTNCFEPLKTKCDCCGAFGIVGSALIRHTNKDGKHEILCFHCHQKEHAKGGFLK